MSKPNPFSDLDDDIERAAHGHSPRRSHPSRSALAAWLTIFTATLAGAFLAGLLLLIVVRWYVVESLKDARQEIRNKLN